MGNVSVHFSGITLDGSQWNVYGLNVIMNRADLMCSTVKVQGDKIKSLFPTVNITRSTFGQFSISDGCHVQISDFNFINTFCKNISISKWRLCVDNSYVKFSYSEVRIIKKDLIDFLVARNSDVPVEETFFSCTAEQVRTISVEGGRLLLKQVVFQDIRSYTLISLQLNVLATIQDTTFDNAHGYIYALNKVDLSMLGCSFIYDSSTQVILDLTESTLSIYDSLLDEVYIYIYNSSSLMIASCRYSVGSLDGKPFISVFSSSKVLVTDTELKGGNVIYGSANFDVKFTNYTFALNEQLIETEGGIISINHSRISGVFQLFSDKNPI